MAGDGRFPDHSGGEGVTARWVLIAAVLVTNAAIITALGPSMGLLAVLAVITGLLALGSALVARGHDAEPEARR